MVNIPSITHKISVCGVQFLLEANDLALEDRDGADAAVHRIFHSGLGFIGQGVNSIFSLVRKNLVEKLTNVASPKDLVDVGEFLRLFRWKIGGKNAIWHAFSP